MDRLQIVIFALITVCYLYFFIYFPKMNNPNEHVRVYMTKSIVEHGGAMQIGVRVKGNAGFYDIGYAYDDYGFVDDKALTCTDKKLKPPNCEGFLYAAKAPGTSFLGVPVYFAVSNVSKLLGVKLDKTKVVYFLRLFAVIVPNLIFLFFFLRFLNRYFPSKETATAIFIAYALGTNAFAYGQMFVGHQLYAAAQFSGFMAMLTIKDGGLRLLKSFIAGFLVAFSVVLEYPALFAAAALTIYFILTQRDMKRIASYLAGALIPAALLSFFHYEAFGAIYKPPYTTLENPGYVQDISPGFMGLREPKLENFYGSFFSPYMGLFFFSPWLIFLFPAILWLILKWRKPENKPFEDLRYELLISVIICAIYAAFISSHSLWRAGWTVGPRYITGIVPFAAFATTLFVSRLEAAGKRNFRLIFYPLIILSLFFIPFTSIIIQGFPPEYLNPFGEMAVPLLKEGYVRPNAGNLVGLKGIYSAIPFFAIILFFILYISFSQADWRHRFLKGFSMFAITAALLFGAMQIKSNDPAAVERATKFLKSVW